MTDQTEPTGVIAVTVEQVKTWFDDDDVLLVDVREASEYDQEHIPGARLMPLSVFDPVAFPVLTEKKVVIHCAVGRRSQTAGEELIKAGLRNVRHMTGGIVEWKERGYATEVQAELERRISATKKRLEELIHPPTEGDESNGLHMIRMAHVGDDVEEVE